MPTIMPGLTVAGLREEIKDMPDDAPVMLSLGDEWAECRRVSGETVRYMGSPRGAVKREVFEVTLGD